MTMTSIIRNMVTNTNTVKMLIVIKKMIVNDQKEDGHLHQVLHAGPLHKAASSHWRLVAP